MFEDDLESIPIASILTWSKAVGELPRFDFEGEALNSWPGYRMTALLASESRGASSISELPN